MKTITIYDAKTGQLGPVISGHPDDLPEVTAFVEGAHDAAAARYDTETNKIVEAPPLPPHINELRQRRNEMLDSYRWTIMPDSPLTEGCKDQWLQWMTSLHGLLVDVTDTSAVVWPPMPQLEYR